MKNWKIQTFILLCFVVFFTGCVNEIDNEDMLFVFDETEFDFGVVKQSQGIVSHDFRFKYVGEEKIEVSGVPTSCACTSAEISSSVFESGNEGVLTVSFDPNLHEEPEGKFFKTVSVLTEPELGNQPELKIWVEMDLDLGPEFYKLKEPHDDEHDDEHADGVEYHNITAAEFQDMLGNEDLFLLDVHIPEQDHIEGTDAFIPYDEINESVEDLPDDKSETIVVYCRSGSMSLSASEDLVDLGYENVFNLIGGRNAFLEFNK